MEYNKLDQKGIDFLKELAGERAFVGSEIHEIYSRDEIVHNGPYPDAVVEVKSAEEVAAIMKYANENNIVVVPRGQGTGLAGAAVATQGGIMISTVLMNNILELDEENLTLTVEPGVLLMDIIKFVDEHDLFYPPDPGEKSASIAGNISTNAGGMRAVKYGVTRDYVRGLEVVLADGRIINVGGKQVKNSSGYALKDLFVGSEGTLGFITKAILKLIPKPKMAWSFLVPFPSLEVAIETVPKIIKAKVIPVAIEFMERSAIEAAEDFLAKEFPDKSANAYLLLTFDGNIKEEIENAYKNVAELCLESGAYDVYISNTNDRNESIWKTRGAFLEAYKAECKELDECDVVVPRNRVADFIKYTHELQEEVGITIKSFGHAGDGNLHVYIMRYDEDDATWEAKLNEGFDKMFAYAKELDGLPSGEHGIGYMKKPYLESMMGEEYMTVLRQIKAALDPKWILNPGKVC